MDAKQVLREVDELAGLTHAQLRARAAQVGAHPETLTDDAIRLAVIRRLVTK